MEAASFIELPGKYLLVRKCQGKFDYHVGFTHNSCGREILEEANLDPTYEISKESEKHKHGTPNPGPASIKKHDSLFEIGSLGKFKCGWCRAYLNGAFLTMCPRQMCSLCRQHKASRSLKILGLTHDMESLEKNVPLDKHVMSYTVNQLGWNNPGNYSIRKALVTWEVPLAQVRLKVLSVAGIVCPPRCRARRRKDDSNSNNDKGELDPKVAKDILDSRGVSASGDPPPRMPGHFFKGILSLTGWTFTFFLGGGSP